MDNKYLPSRKFTKRILIISGVVVLSLLIYTLVKSWTHPGPSPEHPQPVQIKDVVVKDSNSNGIPDWEEYMWGLDPNTNGQSNKDYIVAQKEALAKSGTVTNTNGKDNTPISPNDALSRQYFAVIMSLEQTGNLNDASLKSVSEAIGKKIVAEPITDTYTRGMLTITDNTPESRKNYYIALKTLFDKYKDKNIGDELSFIATALKDNDAHALKLAGEIASSYKAFAKEFISIPVPSTFISIHLDVANNYDKTGQSIDGLTKLFTDPITSMKALVNYNKYDYAMLAALNQLFSKVQ